MVTGEIDGACLLYAQVEHEGSARRAEEEAQLIAEWVGELVGGKFVDHEGIERELMPYDNIHPSNYCSFWKGVL